MRKGVATTAFVEDIVKLKFQVEHLKSQYIDLARNKDLQDTATKRRIDTEVL